MTKTTLAAFAALLAADAAFAGVPSSPETWFDEDFSGMTETSTTKWTTDAGTWTKGSTADASVYSNAENVIAFDTHETEFKFAPKAGSSAANALVKVECMMSFTACRDIEDWTYANATSQQAALGMRTTEDGLGLTFFGWRARGNRGLDQSSDNRLGVWVDLVAAGVEPKEGVTYRVTVENDQSCVPARIRYSVNGVPLADSTGETWLVAKSELAPWNAAYAKKTQTVSFYGRGTVAGLTATVCSSKAERAAVTMAELANPSVGSNITFTVAAIEGKTLGTSLTYAWGREDASGLRVASGLGSTASYAITAADYGHWIVVDVSDENGYAGTGRFWCSELPVAYITVDPDTSGNIWPKTKHKDYTGTMRLAGNAEYAQQYNGAITLHVRGNSTAGADKRPYKLKLDKKTDVFGLGGGTKSKHWVLMANAFDESLMRNKVAMDLSGEYGLTHMKGEWVDVVMNGQFVGNYLFCQQIRVAEERVNVYNWSDAAEKIAEKAIEANPALSEDADQSAIEDVLELDCGWMANGCFTYLGTNYTVVTKGTAGVGADDSVTVVWKKFTTDITGGYLFEIDAKKMAGGESPAACSFVQTNKTSYGTLYFKLAMNTPEYAFTSEAVRSYVWDRWYSLGQAWLSPNRVNTAGEHSYDISDFDSMVGYWLTMYVMCNNDSSAYSRYAYQDQGGKMTHGPAWDFDCGLGSLTIRSRSKVVTNEAGRVTYAAIVPEGWNLGRGADNYFGFWTADPYFTFKAREKYMEKRPYLEGITKDGGLIDQYMEKLGTSAKANDVRWSNRIGFFGNGSEKGDAYVLKEFIARRMAWFDTQFATVAKAVVAATETVGASGLRYVRNANMKVAIADSTKASDSVETDMEDVTLVLASNGAVAASVTIPSGVSAAQVRVDVNGYSNVTWAVSSGAASGSVAATSLAFGRRNMLAFEALDSNGKTVARNIALVTPETRGLILMLQ